MQSRPAEGAVQGLRGVVDLPPRPEEVGVQGLQRVLHLQPRPAEGAVQGLQKSVHLQARQGQVGVQGLQAGRRSALTRLHFAEELVVTARPPLQPSVSLLLHFRQSALPSAPLLSRAPLPSQFFPSYSDRVRLPSPQRKRFGPPRPTAVGAWASGGNLGPPPPMAAPADRVRCPWPCLAPHAAAAALAAPSTPHASSPYSFPCRRDRARGRGQPSCAAVYTAVHTHFTPPHHTHTDTGPPSAWSSAQRAQCGAEGRQGVERQGEEA